ncbi:hypothetical protein RJT34_21733 [Clitoria ternatea]|uniref:Uncharacterized protein n=1 Tax=Clitoria ternatea TaxID=43366 RepID=A0AAN9IUK5_CLITE
MVTKLAAATEHGDAQGRHTWQQTWWLGGWFCSLVAIGCEEATVVDLGCGGYPAGLWKEKEGRGRFAGMKPNNDDLEFNFSFKNVPYGIIAKRVRNKVTKT